MCNFISMEDIDKNQILEIINYASMLKSSEEESNGCDKKIIASLFFEPSTRTRLSFAAATFKLGGKVLGFDSAETSSTQKGETFKDTLKVIGGYSDLVVIRHPSEGAARLAADIVSIPVINAGDGSNEHPSQTMVDLFTIKEELNSLENLKIAFLGDLKYGRTVHSLTKALSLFNAEFYFVANDFLQIPKYILKDLEKKKIKYHILSEYESILSNIDVLYVTRIQKERFSSLEYYNEIKDELIVAESDLLNCKETMIILHPLPRLNEINLDVDESKHAKYFVQANNGVPIRQSMIMMALENQKKIVEQEKIIKKSQKVLCENKNCITHIEITENKTIENDNIKLCYYCNKEISL